MEYIDLRKVGRSGLKEIRRQVVRLKKMGKTGKEIEELTGVRQNRASEIWTAYQREGENSLERKKYGRKPGSHMVLTAEEQEAVSQGNKRANAVGLHEALGHELPASSEACPEAESYRHLKVEKRGISRNFKACGGGECHNLLGR